MEKLEEVHDGMINKNVVNFPVITFEELSKKVNSAVMWLSRFEPLSYLLLGSKYLRVRCHVSFQSSYLIIVRCTLDRERSHCAIIICTK